MQSLSDTARFQTDDPDDLVVASMCCPICLHEAGVQRTVNLEGYDPSIHCHCQRCDEEWHVYLTPAQALRMSLLRT